MKLQRKRTLSVIKMSQMERNRRRKLTFVDSRQIRNEKERPFVGKEARWEEKTNIK